MTESTIKAMLLKLRKRIFMRFSPLYMGIDPASEIVVRSNFVNSIGGLEYDIRSQGSCFRLIILHVEKDLFILTLLITDVEHRSPSLSLKTRFWILDRSIVTLVEAGIRQKLRKPLGEIDSR